jgi:hypothetical protein
MEPLSARSGQFPAILLVSDSNGNIHVDSENATTKITHSAPCFLFYASDIIKSMLSTRPCRDPRGLLAIS